MPNRNVTDTVGWDVYAPSSAQHQVMHMPMTPRPGLTDFWTPRRLIAAVIIFTAFLLAGTVGTVLYLT